MTREKYVKFSFHLALLSCFLLLLLQLHDMCKHMILHYNRRSFSEELNSSRVNLFFLVTTFVNMGYCVCCLRLKMKCKEQGQKLDYMALKRPVCYIDVLHRT